MKRILKLILVIVLITNFTYSQNVENNTIVVEKVEPPFWWINMKNKTLQLMLYGEQINTYSAKINNKNISIDSITKTENSNYLFLNLDLSNIKKSVTFDILLSNKTSSFSVPYELKIRNQNSANRQGFNSSDVVYLIMPDRFANGNPQNDSHKDVVEKVDRTNNGGRHGGDIQGIINNIAYLKDLGVTSIWSTPMLEDNEPIYSYHTYAQSNYYKIDPRFGTNDEYKKLVDKLHENDMKLIMDYVTNHMGSKNWIIQDLPTKDFIHYWKNGKNGFQRSNYRMSTQFDPNASKIDTKACLDGWFDTTMPDMNQKNPLYLTYIIQNAIWWIEYSGIDGLRVDTYSYNDKEGIAKWTKAIMDEYPNFNIVGEIWMHNQAQIAYWQKNSKIGAIQNYNSNLPSVMDFTLYDEITKVFNEDNANWNDGMIKIYENFTNDFLYPNINNILVFAGNHDTNRINEIYQSDIDKYKLAITLLATTRGIPQIYYGDEIGMLGNKNKLGDGDIRRDFPGGWDGDAQTAFSKKGRTKIQEDYHAFAKKLFNWRKNKKVIHSGKTLQFIPENNVYVYFRMNNTDTVMVIINNNIDAQNIDLSRFAEGIKNHKIGLDIISGKTVDLSIKLSVEGKKSMILELN